MKRATGIVAALALLILLAWLLHREPRDERPPQLPRTEVAAAVAIPAPEPVAAAVAPPPSRPREPQSSVNPGNPTLRGTVRLLGEPPRRKKIRMEADPQCAEMHSVPVLMDTVMVDQNGGVQWAFVYVDGIQPPPPKQPLPPVLIDQVRCRFDPHVLGLQVGQPLNIYNTDGILHSVHGRPWTNPEFNFSMAEEEEGEICRTLTFRQPELAIGIRCGLHPWMRAWIGVMDHPYFCVTSAAGSYAIPNLPAGHYTIKVWHEAYVTVAREVDVEGNRDVVLDFSLDARKE